MLQLLEDEPGGVVAEARRLENVNDLDELRVRRELRVADAIRAQRRSRLAVWAVFAAGTFALAIAPASWTAWTGLVFLAALAFLAQAVAASRDRAFRSADRSGSDLAASDARLLALLASSPVGVLEIGRDGAYRNCSRQVRKMLGLEGRAIRGRGWFDAFAAPDRRELRELVENAREIATDGVVVRVASADGRWLRARAAAIENAVADGYMLTFEDVTADREHDALRRSEAELDSLTGLPNRARFLERLGEAIGRLGEADGEVAVVYIDLDRFKPVNDALGHAAGDELLIKVAQRMSELIGIDDFLARQGGDEFTVLVENPLGQDQIFAMIERLQEGLSKPFVLGDGHSVAIGATFGVVMVDDQNQDPDTVLQDSDMAMYSAKHGPQRYGVFEQSLREHNLEQLETEQALRQAMERDEFRLAYQPLVDLATGEMVGAEALLRWQHPTRGLLPPAEFLPLAETTGLIVPIGHWVINSAAHFATEWPEEFKISVNLSAQQLTGGTLVDDMARMLAAEEIRPIQLCVEILESHVVSDETLTIINRLHELGLGIGIDDFGTGYNSLLYLRRFPVDFLKIDRSFVADLRENVTDLSIVTKVVELAHALGIYIVVEGVEEPFQADLVRDAGCDVGQGFHWSRPLLAEDFRALNAEWDADTHRAQQS